LIVCDEETDLEESGPFVTQCSDALARGELAMCVQLLELLRSAAGLDALLQLAQLGVE
jgi:hypothetical protein